VWEDDITLSAELPKLEYLQARHLRENFLKMLENGHAISMPLGSDIEKERSSRGVKASGDPHWWSHALANSSRGCLR